VIDAVAGMDLAEFYAAYRADGHGRAAYDPTMMVALLMYAYSTKVRSSRAIESHCRQDVAYRVITGNVVPDHATIARFVVRHERPLAALFGQVLRLCDQAWLVKPGLIAIDGTRLAGNANSDCTRQFEQIAAEILAEVRAIDESENEALGPARGDELPEQLRSAEGRREFLRKATQKLTRQDEDQPSAAEEQDEAPTYEFDEERIVARTQGREGWLREARRQLEQHRWRDPDRVRRARIARLLLAAERLEDELDAECRGNAAYEEFKARRRELGGNRVGGPPKPYTPPEVPDGKVNISDPDSKRLKAREGYVQGYNAQAVVDEGQIVLAAEITNLNVDRSQLDPMVSATIAELEHAGVQARPEVALADAQYWNEEHIDEVVANKHVQVLIPPDSSSRDAPRPGWSGGRYTWMRYVLASTPGEQLYKRRKQMIEPVFGHTRHNRSVTRLLRRGRSAAVPPCKPLTFDQPAACRSGRRARRQPARNFRELLQPPKALLKRAIRALTVSTSMPGAPEAGDRTGDETIATRPPFGGNTTAAQGSSRPGSCSRGYPSGGCSACRHLLSRGTLSPSAGGRRQRTNRGTRSCRRAGRAHHTDRARIAIIEACRDVRDCVFALARDATNPHAMTRTARAALDDGARRLDQLARTLHNPSIVSRRHARPNENDPPCRATSLHSGRHHLTRARRGTSIWARIAPGEGARSLT
jgi:transposase